MPLTLNSTDEDGRLASEIALAAGWNGANTRSLQECIAHCKDIPLEEEIRINQYESRLAAIYTEKGVPICTHNACNLTGYDSPGYQVVRGRLAVPVGRRAGHQVPVPRERPEHEPHPGHRHGQGDQAAVPGVLHGASATTSSFFTGGYPFLGAWPPRVEEASAMIAWNAIIAILGDFTTAILKSEDEAFATPTKEGMASSVRSGQASAHPDGDPEDARVGRV